MQEFVRHSFYEKRGEVPMREQKRSGIILGKGIGEILERNADFVDTSVTKLGQTKVDLALRTPTDTGEIHFGITRTPTGKTRSEQIGSVNVAFTNPDGSARLVSHIYAAGEDGVVRRTDLDPARMLAGDTTEGIAMTDLRTGEQSFQVIDPELVVDLFTRTHVAKELIQQERAMGFNDQPVPLSEVTEMIETAKAGDIPPVTMRDLSNAIEERFGYTSDVDVDTSNKAAEHFAHDVQQLFDRKRGELKEGEEEKVWVYTKRGKQDLFVAQVSGTNDTETGDFVPEATMQWVKHQSQQDTTVTLHFGIENGEFVASKIDDLKAQPKQTATATEHREITVVGDVKDARAVRNFLNNPQP